MYPSPLHQTHISFSETDYRSSKNNYLKKKSSVKYNLADTIQNLSNILLNFSPSRIFSNVTEHLISQISQMGKN